MSTLRVLHLRNCRGISDVTGPENYMMSLAEGISQDECRMTMACIVDPLHGETPWLREARSKQLSLVTIPVGSRWSWRDVSEVRRLLYELEIDVIHTHDHRADVVGILAAKLAGAASVATCVGWTNWPAGSLRARVYPWLDRLALRSADAILSDSSAMAAQVDCGPTGPPVAVIPNGVDLRRFDPYEVLPILRERWFPGLRGTIFGMVGRIHPNKGQIDFLKTAKELLRTHPDCRFVIVGEAPPGYEPYKKELSTFIEQEGLESVVKITKVPRTDVPNVMAALDVLVAPSYVESFSFTIVEGMAMGKAVVSTDVGGTKEMIRHEETGVLLQPGDVTGLTAALLELIRDESKRGRLGRHAREHVARELSVERMVARTLNVYREILDWRRPRPARALQPDELRQRLAHAASM